MTGRDPVYGMMVDPKKTKFISLYESRYFLLLLGELQAEIRVGPPGLPKVEVMEERPARTSASKP